MLASGCRDRDPRLRSEKPNGTASAWLAVPPGFVAGRPTTRYCAWDEKKESAASFNSSGLMSLTC